MNELHLPWLELTVLIPAVGALWVGRLRDPDVARRHSLVFSVLALLCAVGAWQDFAALGAAEAHDSWDVLWRLRGDEVLAIDELSAPLLPLASLLYLLTHLSTLRTKVRRFSFAWSLAAQAVLLATFSCRDPWLLILLLAIGTVQPWLELRTRRKPQRIYVIHMAVFVGLLACGEALLFFGDGAAPSIVGVALLIAAALLRSGIAPVHCWMTDLFEHATFGTALLFVTPMVGVYAAVRLVLPVAPDWALKSISLLSLATAVYAAGMALVQTEARRFFCYLFLSHSSLVLVGLEIATPVGLTGALCVWISVGLCLAGFGMTLRSIEARTGRLSLREFHGLSEHVPMLAAFFLLTGLASIGFPGTLGFVGTEILVEGAVAASPIVGAVVILTAALNGLAVMQAYFRVFTGARHITCIDLRCRVPERIAVLTLTLLILGGGLMPQPGVSSRHRAAGAIIAHRQMAVSDELATAAAERGSPFAWNSSFPRMTSIPHTVKP